MKAYLTKGALLQFTLKADEKEASSSNEQDLEKKLRLYRCDIKNLEDENPDARRLSEVTCAILKGVFLRNSNIADLRTRAATLTLKDIKSPEFSNTLMSFRLEGEVLGDISRCAALLGYDEDVRVDFEIERPYTETNIVVPPPGRSFIKYPEVAVLNDIGNDVSAPNMPITISNGDSYCEGTLDIPPVWLARMSDLTDKGETVYYGFFNILITLTGDGNEPTSDDEEGDEDEEIGKLTGEE